MATNVKITPNLFIAVKMLAENGASTSEIAKYMKISTATVKHIKNAENYDEYRAIITAIQAKRNEARRKQRDAEKKEPVKTPEPEKPEVKTQVVEHRQSIQISATHYMDMKLDKVIELLTTISAKLAAIIDDLYGTGKGSNAV